MLHFPDLGISLGIHSEMTLDSTSKGTGEPGPFAAVGVVSLALQYHWHIIPGSPACKHVRYLNLNSSCESLVRQHPGFRGKTAVSVCAVSRIVSVAQLMHAN